MEQPVSGDRTVGNVPGELVVKFRPGVSEEREQVDIEADCGSQGTIKLIRKGQVMNTRAFTDNGSSAEEPCRLRKPKNSSVGQKGGIALVGLAVLFVLAMLVMPIAAESQEMAPNVDPHTSVASDGSTFMAEMVSSTFHGEPGFKGMDGEQALDALAEHPNVTESAEEVWALWNLKPTTAPEGVETIIGADSRKRVNPTTSYPARAVALITFDGGRCTGWLYGKDVVATAGHCVHDGGTSGSWHTNVRVYPGRNGNSAPYGSCSAKNLYSTTGWTGSKDERYDYGVVKLNCSIGNTTGWFGYWSQAGSLNGLPTIISGYPGDKPLQQWKSTDKVQTTEARQVFYLNDTFGGMSGSPVYYKRPAGSSGCSGFCSMAIHAYGLHGIPPHSTQNHGTRIVSSVVNNLRAWKSRP